MSAARRSALVLVVLALACGLLLWTTCGQEQDGRGTPATVRGAAIQPAERTTRITDPASDAPSRVASAPPAAQRAQTAASARGTIVVLDAAGVEYPHESGAISVQGRGEPISPVEIAVVDGEWDLGARPEREFFVQTIVLGGREAVLEDERGSREIPREATALRARWLATARLHVVDANSGEELDGVLLYSMSNLSADYVEIPLEVADSTLVGSDLRSPIAVEPISPNTHAGPHTYFAYRHGYAWASIVLDPTAGGDSYLRLSAGADLDVRLSGGDPTDDMTIRLWRHADGGKKLLAERALNSKANKGRREFRIPGLSEAVYEARLEQGSQGSARMLASAVHPIVAGQDAGVELAVPQLLPDVLVSAVIVVELHESWGLETFRLEVTDLDLPRNAPGRSKWVRCGSLQQTAAHVFTSTPLMLRSGRHEIYLREASFGAEVLVARSSPQELRLSVPACCKVSVTVRDGKTGELIEKPVLDWSHRSTEGLGSGRGTVGIAPVAPGRFEFRAPAGEIRVSTSGGPEGMYLPDHRTIQVSPGAQDVVVELQRARSVSILLRDGERRVEGSMAFLGGLELTDAGRRVQPPRSSLSGGTGKMTCTLPLAAKYTLSFPALPGYQPIPPVELDLLSQDSVELVIQLVRQP